MNVFIVRDAVEIGHFPRADIERLARSGQLHPTDYYWHEGMEGWLELPDLIGADVWNPTPAAPAATTVPVAGRRSFALAWDRRIIIGAIGVAFLVVVAVGLYFWNSKRSDTNNLPLVNAASPAPDLAATNLASRDKAAAELKQKIDNLPARPTAPVNAFYYDVSFDISPSSALGVSWTATIHGGENLVVPDTEATVRRTEFVLTAEYRNGDWTFKNYHAVETNLTNGDTTEIEHDEKTPVPPNLIGMLGLKRNIR